MFSPDDPICGPATCLRAEAEDLLQRATEATLACEEHTKAAEAARAKAEAFLALAGRYERAADMLDAAGEQKARG